jgi:hypothetical protein
VTSADQPAVAVTTRLVVPSTHRRPSVWATARTVRSALESQVRTVGEVRIAVRTSTAGSRNDPIVDFDRRLVEHDGVVKTVYAAGSGPGVVVMPEIPGISPDVLRLARWVREAGFTVVVPSLFGNDGAYPTVDGVDVARQACVSAEFSAFRDGGTSPVTLWLRALARQVHAECGGPGVGAIGLCFTGNFALTMNARTRRHRPGGEPPITATGRCWRAGAQ